MDSPNVQHSRGCLNNIEIQKDSAKEYPRYQVFECNQSQQHERQIDWGRLALVVVRIAPNVAVVVQLQVSGRKAARNPTCIITKPERTMEGRLIIPEEKEIVKISRATQISVTLAVTQLVHGSTPLVIMESMTYMPLHAACDMPVAPQPTLGQLEEGLTVSRTGETSKCS